MEVKLNTAQVATATDEFSSLEAVSDKAYSYRLTLSVSKLAALNANATQLVVRVYRENPKNAVALSVFNQNSQTLNVLNQNSRILIQNIQRRAISAMTQIKQSRNASLFEQAYTFPTLVEKSNHGVGYTVITDNPKEAVRNEVYQTGNTINQTGLNEDQTITQLSLDLLNRFQVDPADAIRKTFSSRTAYESNNGLAAQQLINEENKIAASLLSANNLDHIPDVVLQTYSITERDIIPVQFDYVIPSEAVGTNDFFLMFSLYDQDTGLVQEFVKLVSHKSNLRLFQRAKVPPVFSVSKLSGGQLSVSVKQLDPNGTGVKLFKSVYNPTASGGDISQTTIGSFDLPAGETRTLVLQNEDVGTILFRALSYNSLADCSSEFASQVITVSPADFDASKDNAFVSLQYKYTRDGLNVVISQIPDHVAFLRLYRTNLTVDPDLETILTTFYVAGLSSNSSYAYLDNGLEKQKAYRYRCSFIDNKGQETSSSSIVELYYRPQTQDYAVATFSSPVITPVQLPGNSTQYYDVSFDVAYAITNKLEDTVKQLLTNQGLLEYFGGDINRERLKDLLVTKVEVRDLETNDKVFLAFVDKTFRQSATKYGLLTRPSQYSYEMTTYVRNPATLLQSVVLSGSSTPRTSGRLAPRTYSYVPFNVNHPYGLLTGTNPQSKGAEFVQKYGLDQLEFGEVTGIDYIDIDLKAPSPSINGLRAVVYNSKNVELNWSVNGNQDNISHFIIRRQNVATGQLDLVGAAHGVNIQNNFTYVDPIRYTDTGVFRYILTMQYFNMHLSPDYPSNEVVI